ncbi:MAG TPA: anthranilate phosphoribosyltransferase [Tepidisphaeraceae bacterium]|nr:anthranilate phosphoribosyltransferase [Tepidisphaeraceae bacterium]
MSNVPGTILSRLSQGRRLSREEARAAVLHITSGQAAETEIHSLLTHLTWQDATVDELTGAALAMREKVIPLSPGDIEVLDTCGTGGDTRNTFNISTAAALIAASCGVKIVKHGNRSASSRAGSADVLEKLGVHLEPSAAKAAECLEVANICFAFARAHHPAMKHVAEVRKKFSGPTIFNLLGPLTNPAGARLHLLGVFNAGLTHRLACVLRDLGGRRAWVVHAEDGLDEISTIGPTQISELRDGQVHTWTLDAREYGLPAAKLGDLQVADVNEAAAALTSVLAGEAGPRRAIARLNAAAAMVIAGRCEDLRDGLEMAAEALDCGRARQTLADLVRLTNTR